MATYLFPAAQIPLEPFLLLGTQGQAEGILCSTDIGSALLNLEFEYGNLSREDHYEAVRRLEGLKPRFRERVAEMSGPLTHMHELSFFFERGALFPARDSGLPALLSDFLLQRRRGLVPGSESPAALGLAAHLGGTLDLKFFLSATPEGRLGLWCLEEGALLTFEGKRPELVMMAEGSSVQRPLITSLFALYLEALGRTHEDRGRAARLHAAAQALHAT